jgi:Cu-processing system ATP-binding protein
MTGLIANDILVTAATKSYAGKVAVRNIDLAVSEEEHLALLGPNGAGKTSLVKLMLGLTRPTSGSVRVMGADPASRSAVELRRKIGYLPENVAFHGTMTGREMLMFYARLKGERFDKADAFLDQVGLADAADRRIRTYSKGMRQRLGLAQALLGTPRLLFLDEPTTGLDPSLRKLFYEVLANLKHAGVTALISSHALSEIEARTDSIAIMKEGQLTARGTLDELRKAAGLQARIRVSVSSGSATAVADGIGNAASVDRINDHVVDLTCPPDRKMTVMRKLAELGDPVCDVDITLPRLEEVYAYYTGEDAAG